jgi:PAS domain S-box-containing protein
MSHDLGIRMSQPASGEIVLEKLTDALMRTAIEQAGAERGMLILSRGGEPRIVAEATTEGDDVLVRLADEPAAATALPTSILHYVLRTREGVIFDDASAESPFPGDPYIRLRRVRSVLCLPLMNCAALSGVLYLENNLAPRVFAPARTAVLKLLALQAAITLENTRLYRDLAEREARMRRLVDAGIIGIFIWDFDGRILEANDTFLRIVGYDREDLAAGRLRWTDLTPQEWRDRDVQRWIPVHRMTGRLPPIEKEYVRKDGSRVPVLIGAATFEETGTQGVAFVLDLTEHKQAQQALRESEEQWKAVFENNPTMYFILDAAGTITSVNPYGAEHLGYTFEDLIGRPARILFHEADREDVERHTATCIEQLGQTMSWEARKLRKDGEIIWVRETARAMLIKQRPSVLIVCEDITEGKRAAEALREVQTELAHANRVATLGQLTASMAHELRQPIGATVSNAQAALRWLGARSPNLEEARQALGRIIRDANRAGDVIGRIRALVEKAPPRRDVVSLNEAILEVVGLVQSEAVKHRVALRTRLAEGLPPVRGDRVQLQQVVLNLVVNGVEAMHGVAEGVPRDLLVRTAPAASGEGVLVAVLDSGPGVNVAETERLFEAFHTTKPGGLGMGLSICRSIVEAHGGRLWAGANSPRGAVFQFELPAEGGMDARAA